MINSVYNSNSHLHTHTKETSISRHASGREYVPLNYLLKYYIKFWCNTKMATRGCNPVCQVAVRGFFRRGICLLTLNPIMGLSEVCTSYFALPPNTEFRIQWSCSTGSNHLPRFCPTSALALDQFRIGYLVHLHHEPMESKCSQITVPTHNAFAAFSPSTDYSLLLVYIRAMGKQFSFSSVVTNHTIKLKESCHQCSA